MATHALQLAESADDLVDLAALWPSDWGKFEDSLEAQRFSAKSMASGSLILVRQPDDGRLLGATVLDLTTYPRSLFIPVSLVSPDLSAKHRAAVRSSIAVLVLRFMLSVDVHRVLLMKTHHSGDRDLVERFAERLEAMSLPIRVEYAGAVDDLFGDGRKISVGAVFIPPEHRPDVLRRAFDQAGLDDALRNAVDKLPQQLDEESIAMMVNEEGGGGGCSGCNETNKSGSKDKDGGKEGKEVDKDAKDHGPKEGKDGGGKDGGGIERTVPGFSDPHVQGVFAVYQAIGVQSYRRGTAGGKFHPLV